MPENLSNWGAFVAAEPELAQTVEARFGAFTHHVLATLRRDGSPRTTGLEVRFAKGELWLGMMPDSFKALDLRRDPRFSLQANPGPGTGMGGGDVRVSGRAVEVDDPAVKAAYGAEGEESGDESGGKSGGKSEEVEPPEPFHLFRTELTEVVRTYVEDDKYLVVQVWKPGEPVRALKRT
ncbi:pyridoxamine 5'-phosphate oxidase family protein [Streptomyces sp. NBC_00487]|uniref:pyridoxamine 5'-phosphate oxidase family protein n=1 Tax=unclassified Streptomyces TaxID=2593676 RepID=UPI002E18D1BA|nr:MULTISPECIES: pyridoxamine 5'-phosphate oxidase family protein [unclassified Streptomyces]